ncbi:polysaccharide export outer membrane protein [Sphingorhabdus rigui]|uniref:Polysaccharide export outer membrane protein n=1 Tax=Sphingorhabdus rigui TaxID=1282858 RepID=A0A840B241_9SPHN|nr:polysaccharide biosynthesis/export family protein [Sphingorhabdus rigui]MBB3944011.1 polysaccharide export outer membrane protein [Sphingorhabdus rigui]
MQILKSLGIGLALLVLSVHASAADDEPRAGLQMVSADELPAPSLADLQASERPYRVGPFDKLTIDVFGSAELSDKEVQVDASGRITFPLVGTVEVAGKTPGEVSVALQDLFRGRFIKNPQVTVNLKEIVSQTVTIGGEVKKPGVYPIVGKMTLMTAIASAEGWTDISSRGSVAVFRTVGGKDYAALYNVKAIQKGNYPDPEIYASDVVMVGDSQGRKIWKDFLAASPLLAPVIYLLNSNN